MQGIFTHTVHYSFVIHTLTHGFSVLIKKKFVGELDVNLKNIFLNVCVD